jgi:hypothetical protein
LTPSKLVFERLGMSFHPAAKVDWSFTHAQVPFVRLEDKKLFAYFSTRGAADSAGQYVSSFGRVPLRREGDSFVGCADESVQVFGPGELGHFDDTGVMGGSVVMHKGIEYLFYCGWTRRATVPYEWSIGRATRKEGESTFTREFGGPVLGSSPDEPFLHASPIVFEHNGSFHMFYLSGTEWFVSKSGKPESVYRLRHATSTDLLSWTRLETELFDRLFERESQTSSAIFEWDGEYHMLFSYRDSDHFREDNSRNYRIGHATSQNIYDWKRQADVEWVAAKESTSLGDETMQAYPSVFVSNRTLYMLYCGDRFGEGGFFLSKLISDFSGIPITGPVL